MTNSEEDQVAMQQQYDAERTAENKFIQDSGAQKATADDIKACVGDSGEDQGSSPQSYGLLVTKATDTPIPQTYGSTSKTFFLPGDLANDFPQITARNSEIQPLRDQISALQKQLEDLGPIDSWRGPTDAQHDLQQQIYELQMQIAYTQAYYEEQIGHNVVVICGNPWSGLNEVNQSQSTDDQSTANSQGTMPSQESSTADNQEPVKHTIAQPSQAAPSH